MPYGLQGPEHKERMFLPLYTIVCDAKAAVKQMLGDIQFITTPPFTKRTSQAAAC